jgi:Flp pilus assembly protein TadG
MIGERCARTCRRSQSGLATVEFVLSVPVLLLLMFATFELGHFLIQYSTLNDTVRNASRYVAGNALDGTTGDLKTGSNWSSLASQGTNLAVFGNTAGTGAPVLPSLNAANIITVTPDAVDKYITITAAYPYQPLFGAAIPTFMGGGSIATAFTLNLSVTMSAL